MASQTGAREEDDEMRARPGNRDSRLGDLQHRLRASAAVVLAAVTLAAAAGGATTAAARSRAAVEPGSRSFIVRAVPGREAAAEAAVQRLGGRIRLRLRLINGFSAQIPDSAVARLRSLPAVARVTADRTLRPLTASYSQTGDSYSMYNITRTIGARQYWNAGYTGAGVGVAMIDSGVVPVDGLTAPGKIVNGPDISFDGQSASLQYLDAYGHGTHMAGIIGGQSDAAAARSPADLASDTTDFLGVAPGARIVNVKVADAHGATDVSQVIAAIDWVVQHRNDQGLNIRVLNLSYGTDSTQSYLTDPLSYAAEQAWKYGLFVVVAAGNAGYAKGGTMTDPAADPFVMSVGAVDTLGTLEQADDTYAPFSSSGVKSGAGHVELAAPGAHIASLRAPGSYVDQMFGSSGYVDSGIFRGSGTSQAAAMVAGAAALVLQQRPSLTPDQLKLLLTQTAAKVKGNTQQVGAGEINLAAALTAKEPKDALSAMQKWTPSTGLGTIEGSRGSSHVSMNGVTLQGEQDIFGVPVVASVLAQLEAAASSWSGGTWNGSSWSASSWSASSWSGSSWSASSWSASSWSDAVWAGSSWSDSAWANAIWG